MRRFRGVFLVLVLAACGRTAQVGSPPPPPPERLPEEIVRADQLIAAMHDRYATSWYRTITFDQASTFLRPDGTPSRVETWYEAALLPGKLRIDLGDIAKGNGVLYRGDSVYQVQGGRVTHRTTGRNLLLTLGFDVYLQPPDSTLAQLRRAGVNTAVLHRHTLDGRAVFVVGAGPNDTTSNQFWVDAERLLFVRLIQSDPQRRRSQDIRFENYVQHGGGWVAERVRFLSGGRLVFREEYSNVRVNVPVDSNLFVPERWHTARHWRSANGR